MTSEMKNVHRVDKLQTCRVNIHCSPKSSNRTCYWCVLFLFRVVNYHTRYFYVQLLFQLENYSGWSNYYTMGTIYSLSLIMKNSNLSWKIAPLFFKVFFFMFYRLLHAFGPCVVAFFPFRLRHLQNMILSNYMESNVRKSFSRLNVYCWLSRWWPFWYLLRCYKKEIKSSVSGTFSQNI